MNKDELIKEVVEWILSAEKGQLPYEFNAKAIIAIVLDTVEEVAHDVRTNYTQDVDSYPDGLRREAIEEVLEAINKLR